MAERSEQVANPLFVYILEGLLKQAQEKQQTKLVAAYAKVGTIHGNLYFGTNARPKALRSVKRYPLKLKSGEEAKILDGVGDFIAGKLNKYLDKLKHTWKQKRRLASSPSVEKPRKRKRVASPIPGTGRTSVTEKRKDYAHPLQELDNLPRVTPAEAPPCDLESNFEVVLLLDNREIKSRDARTYIRDQLVQRGVNCETRQLPLGDAIWVARKRGGVHAQPNEVMFDLIVERKVVSDLARSIVDGRYYEQKFRLQRSGLSRMIYLVEGDVAKEAQKAHSLPVNTLENAMMSTMVSSGFVVTQTAGVDSTVGYLVAVTRVLSDAAERFVAREAARGGPVEYTAWSDAVGKSQHMTVQAVFGKQLMQLHGCSGERAAAIVERYPTPRALLAAYARLSTDAERRAMLADIIYVTSTGNSKRLGPAFSARVYEYYGA